MDSEKITIGNSWATCLSAEGTPKAHIIYVTDEDMYNKIKTGTNTYFGHLMAITITNEGTIQTSESATSDGTLLSPVLDGKTLRDGIQIKTSVVIK